jgi:hypothetical protein
MMCKLKAAAKAMGLATVLVSLCLDLGTGEIYSQFTYDV